LLNASKAFSEFQPRRVLHAGQRATIVCSATEDPVSRGSFAVAAFAGRPPSGLSTSARNGKTLARASSAPRASRGFARLVVTSPSNASNFRWQIVGETVAPFFAEQWSASTIPREPQRGTFLPLVARLAGDAHTARSNRPPVPFLFFRAALTAPGGALKKFFWSLNSCFLL